MPAAKVKHIIAEGVDCLKIAAKKCKQQHEAGRVFIFEHPRNSKAWKEEELEELRRLPGVYVCHFDMCRYGMRVKKDLNKKPTTMIVNSESIAQELQRRCDGSHTHEHLMGGLAAAAEYPVRLCRAILKGLKKHLAQREPKPEQEVTVLAMGLEDELDEEIERAGESRRGPRDEEEDEDEEEAPAGEEQTAEQPQQQQQQEAAVSREDKMKIQRMHNNLGHPALPSFLRFLKAGRVRQEVVKWVAREFSCPTCKSHELPKAPRPAVVPKCYAPGVAMGLDVFYIPDELNQRSLPVLNMLDLGTNYQMVEVLESKEPLHIWRTMWRTWARTFGLPQYISVDEGREFRAGFAQMCASAGTLVFRAAARAPWQQGKVERHGGLMKTLLEKSREEMPPTSRHELVHLIYACEAAKNRFSNRSGYSPAQRQIGQWPRMPSSLMSDEELDPTLQAQHRVDDFEKLMEMRRVAQDAFMKTASREAAARAVKARPRVQRTFKAGDVVYVFRSLRKKKAIHQATVRKTLQQKASWVGPGHVLALEGSVVWVNMFGELWRAAVEQVRLATTEERLGIEVVSEEFEEMQERLKRSSHRAGYRDVSEEAWPEVEEEDPERQDRRGAEEEEDEVRAEGDARGRPRIRFDEAGAAAAEEDYSPGTPVAGDQQVGPPGGSQASATGARGSHEAATSPTQAGTPTAAAAAGDRQISSRTEVEPDQEAEIKRMPTTEEMEAIMRSIRQSDRLDGHPPQEYEAKRDKLEGRWRRSQTRPYWNEVEVFFQGEDEEKGAKPEAEEGEDSRPTRDYWVYDPIKKTLQRHHVVWRKNFFNPIQAEGSPIPLRALGKGRRTIMVRANGEEEKVEDEWSLFAKREEKRSWWKGITEFPVDQHFLLHTRADSGPGKKKRGEGEVFPHEIKPEEWPEWEVQDREEFQKIVRSGALRVLSLEESRAVKARLKAEGKANRILPSRMVRRYKPGEGPGAPRSLKSRFCIRGDCDPDAASLERFAPTVTTSNLQVVIQMAVNKRFRGKVGDLKSAFTQSKPLVRDGGPLYCRACHGSMPGLHEEQIAEVILGCYGLMDAPLNWRQTLTAFIQEDLKYTQSSLDPCTYIHFDKEGKIRGVIAVEVDDLLMFGDEVHEKKVEELQKRFSFGKLKEITQEGVDFNGRRLRMEGDTVLIDMQAFVQERLKAVELEKERMKQKNEPINEQERSRVRSACGALNWLGREGRPDAAAAASLFSSQMVDMKVEDIIELNHTIARLKEEPELSLRIQPIDEKDMRWGVITDASYANARGGKTQAGHMLISFHKDLLAGKCAATNLLHWRSGKLQRTVGSTLAAETQSLARGVGDLLWMIAMYLELTEPSFQLREWRKFIGRVGYTAFSKYEKTEEMQDALALVDAKSLYDLLIHETTGGTDRRNALDVQVLREELKEFSGKIRWVEHMQMPADCLTKKRGRVDTLHRILKEGTFGITEEATTLKERLSVRKEHGYNRR